MKKVLALVLAAAMAFSMVACGGNKTATSGSAEGTATGSSNVTVQLGPNPETLDPALNSAIDEMCIRDRYWVSMARIVRSQILTLKEAEYVTAARALGASNGRIIKKHLLTNCIGTLIVTTTLQIPSSIFTESFMSFLGMGVAVPLPSLGSLATDALKGMNTYPHLLFLPAAIISIIILSFNLLGDGLRDAFDPKLKN